MGKKVRVKRQKAAGVPVINPDGQTAKSILRSISDYDEGIAALLRQGEALQRKKMDSLSLLAKRIKGGDSTGDVFNDFLALQPILMNQPDSLKGRYVERLKRLAALAEESLGQPALISTSRLEGGSMTGCLLPGNCALMPSLENLYRHYRVDFGVLDRAGLFFDLAFPAVCLISREWLRMETDAHEALPSPDAEQVNVNRRGGKSMRQKIVLPRLDKLIEDDQFYELNGHWEMAIGIEAVRYWASACQDVSIRVEIENWLRNLAEK